MQPDIRIGTRIPRRFAILPTQNAGKAGTMIEGVAFGSDRALAGLAATANSPALQPGLFLFSGAAIVSALRARVAPGVRFPSPSL
jgi:hypothetical protein